MRLNTLCVWLIARKQFEAFFKSDFSSYFVQRITNRVLVSRIGPSGDVLWYVLRHCPTGELCLCKALANLQRLLAIRTLIARSSQSWVLLLAERSALSVMVIPALAVVSVVAMDSTEILMNISKYVCDYIRVRNSLADPKANLWRLTLSDRALARSQQCLNAYVWQRIYRRKVGKRKILRDLIVE